MGEICKKRKLSEEVEGVMKGRGEELVRSGGGRIGKKRKEWEESVRKGRSGRNWYEKEGMERNRKKGRGGRKR